MALAPAWAQVPLRAPALVPAVARLQVVLAPAGLVGTGSGWALGQGTAGG